MVSTTCLKLQDRPHGKSGAPTSTSHFTTECMHQVKPLQLRSSMSILAAALDGRDGCGRTLLGFSQSFRLEVLSFRSFSPNGLAIVRPQVPHLVATAEALLHHQALR